MQDRFRKKLWHTNRKEFIKEFSILQTVNSEGNFEHTYFERNPKLLELERLSTCQIKEIQCTGLKDKNGKLIYEGDVLKEAYFDTDKEEFDFNYIKIGYDEKWCSYYQQSIGYDYKEAFPEFDFKEENIEVIGNIYENPELLKGDFNE